MPLAGSAAMVTLLSNYKIFNYWTTLRVLNSVFVFPGTELSSSDAVSGILSQFGGGSRPWMLLCRLIFTLHVSSSYFWLLCPLFSQSAPSLWCCRQLWRPHLFNLPGCSSGDNWKGDGSISSFSSLPVEVSCYVKALGDGKQHLYEWTRAEKNNLCENVPKYSSTDVVVAFLFNYSGAHVVVLQ